MPNHCYNRLTITSDNHGLLIQMRDAALMEDEKLLEFLCPFTKKHRRRGTRRRRLTK